MRSLVIPAILLLIVGCQDRTPKQAVRVGMPMAAAKAILADAGAEETRLQLLPINDAVMHYALRDGRALIVGGGKEPATGEMVVTGLTIMVFGDPSKKGPTETTRVDSFQP